MEKLYFREYKDFSLDYNSYLFADSHGLPLNDFTNKYGIYNFSEASESYFDIKRKLEFLISKTKVDTVFISVDNHTLSTYREKLNNLDRSVIFTTRSNYKNFHNYFNDKYLKYYCVFLSPKYGKILLRYILSFVSSNLKKTSWDELESTEMLRNAEKRLTSQFPSKEVSSDLKKCLLEIVSICSKNKITLIGIKFPMTKQYLDLLNEKSYGADKLFLENNLKILDFQQIFTDRSEYFLDQDHLNKKGGAKFVKEHLIKNL